MSFLLSVMRGVSLSPAQPREDASWISGRSPERCLMPLFSLIGQSASSCTLAPVPFQTAMLAPISARQPSNPKIIISSSNSPGITIVAPHKGQNRCRVQLSATDNDGYFVTDGHMLLKDDGSVRIAAQTEAFATFIPLVSNSPNAGRVSGQSGGGGDITAIAVFFMDDSQAPPHAVAQGLKNELHSTVATSADNHGLTVKLEDSPLLLVYASSSFADERVCLRAKMLQLHIGDCEGSWNISTEADLLLPPSKDNQHFDITCIIGHRGLIFASDTRGYVTCWALQSQLVQSDVLWRTWAHPGSVSSMTMFEIRKTYFILSGGPCDSRLILWSLDGQLLCSSCVSGNGIISIAASSDMIAVETSAGVDIFVVSFYLEGAFDSDADDDGGDNGLELSNLLKRKRTLPCRGPMCFAEPPLGSRSHYLLYSCSSSQTGALEVLKYYNHSRAALSHASASCYILQAAAVSIEPVFFVFILFDAFAIDQSSANDMSCFRCGTAAPGRNSAACK